MDASIILKGVQKSLSDQPIQKIVFSVGGGFLAYEITLDTGQKKAGKVEIDLKDAELIGMVSKDCYSAKSKKNGEWIEGADLTLPQLIKISNTLQKFQNKK